MKHSQIYPLHPVLLVDDKKRILDSYRVLLKSHGIDNTLCCRDSREVMSILENRPVELVVLDLVMPHIRGEQLLEDIHLSYPGIPVIVASGLTELNVAVRCMKKGAWDYLTKPVDGNRFVMVIKRIIQMKELQHENRKLKQHILSDGLEKPDAFNGIVTRNPQMISIFKYIEAVSSSAEPILVTGETGVGKELVARSLHQLSGKEGRFVSVNVAGLEDTVFSDTLFGHMKGAFTDAFQSRRGLVQEAEGGTLFLDEIGDMALPSQAKLLRLLQEKEYYPIGSDRKKQSNCRVVCATNRSLDDMIQGHNFRNDLFYRLRIHHIHIPPLRERKDDIPLLVYHFLDQAASDLKKKKPGILPESLAGLKQYPFPGNVRELRALVYDTVSTGKPLLTSRIKKAVYSTGKNKTPHPNSGSGDFNGLSFNVLPTLQEAEEKVLKAAIKETNGNIRKAARLLGIHRQTLYNKLKRMEHG